LRQARGREGHPPRRRVRVQAEVLRLPRLLAQSQGHVLLAGVPGRVHEERLPPGGQGRAIQGRLTRPVRIGCSGWNYADWRERVYPKGVPARRWLEHYATLFDTGEVNATFYRLPT